MGPPIKGFATAIAFCILAAPSSAVCKDYAFLPLPDLTVENVSEQVQRCSAFYAAFSGLLSETLIETDDPVKSAQILDLIERTNANSDGLLKAAVVLLTTQDKLSDAEAAGLAVDRRSGYSVKYLRRFIESRATILNPFIDGLWKNDTASCGALISNIGPLLDDLIGQ